MSPTSYDVITNVIYGPQWKHPSTYLPCFIVIAKRTSEDSEYSEGGREGAPANRATRVET